MKNPFIYFVGAVFLSGGIGCKYGEEFGCIVFGVCSLVYYFTKEDDGECEENP